jgi:hypothetical protein
MGMLCTPGAWRFESAGPEAAPGGLGGLFLRFVIAIGNRHPLLHHPCIDGPAKNRATRQNALIPVYASGLTRHSPLPDQFFQELPGFPATSYAPPLPLAGLAQFRRIDAIKADILPVQAQRISIDCLGQTRALTHQRREPGDENQGHESEQSKQEQTLGIAWKKHKKPFFL